MIQADDVEDFDGAPFDGFDVVRTMRRPAIYSARRMDPLQRRVLFRELLEALFEVLTSRERNILICLYGLDGTGEPDRARRMALAREYRVGVTAVRRIERKAIDKLRCAMVRGMSPDQVRACIG